MSNEARSDNNIKFEPLPDPKGVPIEKINTEKINNLMRSVGHTIDHPNIGGVPMADEDMMVLREEEVECGSREFVIGDHHFGDPNIIPYNNRPFVSVEEMNRFMIDQWNSVVTNNDTVFVLGDFFDFDHCDDIQVFEILDYLQGHIVLIAGNHDRGNLDVFRAYGIEVIEYPIIKDGFWFLSHEPMFVTETAPYANIFAHVHLNPMYKTVSSRSFCVSVERHDYKPVLLSEVKDAVRNYSTWGGLKYGDD
jgi:calcineurin-like phosphoesterase family protein